MSDDTNSKGREGKGAGSSGDNGGGDSGFVVRDRRRFESDGRAKEEEAGSEKLASDSRSSESRSSENIASIGGNADKDGELNQSQGVSRNTGGGDGEGFEEVSFSSFVMSLATQALMQLGVVAPPQGYELPQDLHGAKQTIDLLQMLQEKTKGNLDAQEAALLEDVLHNVRLAFVRRK